MVNRNAAINKNNFMETRQDSVAEAPPPRPVQQQRPIENLDDDLMNERRHIREQDKGHQPFNDMDAGRMSDDEPEVARIRNRDKASSK